MTNLISFVILLALLVGRRLAHKNRRLHVRWMSAVIVADLTLVIYLVMGHKALDRIEPGMPTLLMIHIFFALSTVFLYGLAVWTGVHLLCKKRTRFRMKTLDRWIVPFRIMTFVTSLGLQFL